MLTYSLGGTDADSFDIDTASGQIRTKAGVTYDHEARSSYALRVSVTDGTDTVTIDVTVTVTDVDEPPVPPAAPAVRATVGTTDGLDVSWPAPDNADRPDVTGYDLRYSVAGTDFWREWEHSGTGRSATLTGLAVGTAYEVQVRATNDEGTGDWSASGRGATAAPPTPFSPGSGLVPDGLEPGDTFRLLFVTSTTGVATSSDIADYNAFVQTAAAAGHADIQAHASLFAVVASTPRVDARDNTATAWTDAVKGVPIYWLGGSKVADQYKDFYDGSWDDEANPTDEAGAARSLSNYPEYPFTGSDFDGTASTVAGQSRALGAVFVKTGRPGHSGSTPLSAFQSQSSTGSRPFYALSPVFVVAEGDIVAASSSALPSGLAQGATLRLLFATSTTGDGDSTDIADYNAFVQAAAAAGHADIRAHRDGFRVVASTADVAARDNTETRYTASDKGLPIYWLGGNKVADDYEGFYDGSWDDEAGSTDESGNARSLSGNSNWPFTGSDADGTQDSPFGNVLGTDNVRVGRPNDDAQNTGPLTSLTRRSKTESQPFYALSPVLQVGSEITVPSNWSLNPSGLTTGDRFRLLFVSSTTTTAGSSDIADYNAVVQAAAGHGDIGPYSHTFRMVGSTEAVDARDNTATTGTGVPIYWLGGARVADDHADFHDGAWDAEAEGRDETGTAVTLDSSSQVWTGSERDGTEAFDTDGASRALGNAGGNPVRVGRPNSPDSSHGPLAGGTAAAADSRRVYALSGVFTVGTQAVANSAPVFSDTAPAQRSVAENPEVGTAVGDPVAATDDNLGDTLMYSLGGTDAASFGIDPASGQIETKQGVTYDHEAKASYAVDVSVTDGTDTVTIAVTVTVTDVAEPPPAPAAPTVRATAGASDSLDVTWTAPDNAGRPGITAYALRYAVDGSLSWSQLEPSGTDLTATVASLAADTTYAVQVRAANADGNGAWSDSGRGATNAAPTPVSADWGLVPAGLELGDSFRLLFATSTVGDASATDIADYNTFVQTAAAAGHADIQAHSDGFRVVASTAAVDARDNTETTYDADAPGVPIYWLGGARVADDYEGFYDGGWDDEAGATDEAGRARSLTASSERPYTGSNHDGTQATGKALGSDSVRVGRPHDSGSNDYGPIGSDTDSPAADERPFYALSAVFVVARASVSASWSLAPDGLATGDRFRLLFATSTTRNAESTDIADYNTFVQTAAAAGHADIRDLSAGFRVVGSTATVDARDNTATTYTDDDLGVPIYWLNGSKVADQYKDFYDGSWADEAGAKDESGADRSLAEAGDRPFTGSGHDGTAATTNDDPRALGAASVRLGRPGSPVAGDGPIGSGSAIANTGTGPFYALSGVLEVVAHAPVFGAALTTREVPENAAAGTAVGAPVAATDDDPGDILTYSLVGTDAASFDIDTASGQIRTKEGVTLDHEARSRYTVEVSVSDGSDTVTIEVTIEVTDEDEPPAAPGAPAVSPTEDTFDSLDVTWSAPANAGRPAITGYGVRYAVDGSDAWQEWDHTGTELAATITGLADGTDYEVQVRAANAEGAGDWSASGRAATEVAPRPVPSNSALVHSDLELGDTFRLLFATGIRNAASTDIADYNAFVQAQAAAGHADIRAHSAGFRVVASTADVDARDNTETRYTANDKGLPIYWLDGDKVADDYEDFYDGSWDDEAGGTDRNGDAPANWGSLGHELFTGSGHNGRERIDVAQSRALGFDFVGVGRPNHAATNAGPLRSENITVSKWNQRRFYALSEVFIVVAPNIVPVFTDGADTTRSVPENTVGVEDVGTPVGATDENADNTLVYSLGGPDAAAFTIDPATGQLRTAEGVTYDHEADPSYELVVSVTDGFATVTIDVTVTVTDVAEPPSTPAAPAVRATAGTTDSLTASWTAPDSGGGPPIGDYDVRYSADGTGFWRDGGHTGTGLTATVTGLAAGTAYEVQVRSRSDEGASAWSDSGRARTHVPPTPVSSGSGIVPDGLAAGATFRVLFATSMKRDATSTDIADYNEFVQDAAAAGHADIRAHSAGFRVVGSTVTVDARDNTAPTYTEDMGVPIYWLGGGKVADDYADFYDGSWDDETGSTDESGDARALDSAATWPFTGSTYDGMANVSDDTTSSALGASAVTIAQPGTGKPIEGGQDINSAFLQPFYGLSPVFAVAAGDIVPESSTATPSDLAPGATFRLLFATSTTRDATATDIADYNTFVQTAAAAGHADIRARSAGFRVVGSTADVDARDNTASTFDAASTDKGPPVYWVGGNKVADDYQDFYDGDWDDEAGSRNEFGAIRSLTGPVNWPFTGSERDGTGTFNSILMKSRALGGDNVTVGRPNDDGTGAEALTSGNNIANTDKRPFYALSGVLVVGSETAVPADWSLIPTGVATGARFRLLFVSSTGTTAAASDIGEYNGFVRTAAAAGHADIRAYSGTFRVVGSTEAVDARDNTSTTGAGVPIYWLGGNRVADDYADFHDGAWDEEAEGRNESGTAVTLGSGSEVWTGSEQDGTEALDSGTSRALGKDPVRLGRPNHGSHGPLSGNTAAATGSKSVYGLSGVFRVGTHVVASVAPVFADTSPAARSVPENPDAGTEVGASVSANDGNTDDMLTYSLGGTDAGSFDIDSDTGQIRTKEGVTYDHEAGTSYEVVVSVTDGTHIVTIDVTIGVSDVDEPPDAPDAPAVRATAIVADGLDVSWTAPDTAGRPDVTDYDLRYALAGSEDWNELAHTGTGLAATVTGLAAGTAYDVQVRATNAEGTGAWSDSGQGTTNAAPTPVARNSDLVPAGLGLGDSFRLLFATSTTRTATSGDIADYNAFVQTAAAGGHADIRAHSAAVRVVGSTAAVDARDNTATTYTAGDKGVAVYWLGGSKVADDYEGFYDGGWDDEANPKDESASARSLSADADRPYTGSGDDGTESFSGRDSRALGTAAGVEVGQPGSAGENHGPLGSGSTRDPAESGPFYGLSPVFVVSEVTVPSNWALKPDGLTAGDAFRLLFATSTARNAESTDIADYNVFVQTLAAAGHAGVRDYSDVFRVVGSTADVDARDNTATTYTDDDKGVAIYWLGGAKLAADYEDFYDGDWDDEANPKDEIGDARDLSGSPSYPFTGSGGDGTERFNSANQSNALGSTTSVAVGRPNGSAGFEGPLHSLFAHPPSTPRPFYALSAVFRVGSGTIDSNSPPVFRDTAPAARSVAENTGAGENVGAAVRATDANVGDTLTYSVGGTDAASFDIVSTSGQIQTKSGVTYDHEAKPSHSLEVSVTDATEAVTLAVTVTVTDVAEQPATPAAPTVAATANTTDSLDVSWTAPGANGGPPLTGYRLRYRKGMTGSWTDQASTGTGTSATIGSLDAGESYQVQVQALNGETPSDWSPSGTGSTASMVVATLSLSLSPATVAENAPATTVTVTAQLNAALSTSTEVTVTDAGTGTATSATDYTAISNFTVTINANESSGTAMFSFTPSNDTDAEPNETVVLSASATGFDPATATLTITDDDAPTVIALSVSPDSVAEDAGATDVTVTAALDAPATSATTVTVSQSGGTATSGTDYTAIGNFTVTIAASATSGAATLSFAPTNDTDAESDETVVLSGTSSGLESGTATLTITDDDTPTAIALSVSPDSVAENAGATDVTVTAELNAPAASETTVSVSQTGGTATSGTDYTAISGFTVTIDANQTSGTATLSFTPTDDSDAESNETVVLSGAADGLESGTATLTITDDDTPTAITLSVNPDSVAEDATATTVTVTAELNGSALSTATTVTVTDAGTGTATSGTDYEAVTSFTVTIDATQTSGTATFTLTPANDSAAEPNETVVLSGAADGLESGTATLTITDDDTPTAIALSVSPDSVAEDATATTVTVTAELNGSALSTATTVTVTDAGTGTATSGTDYEAVTSFTVTIDATQTSGTATFTLTPTNDSAAEPNETVVLSGAADGLESGTATLTITDDDTPTAIALSVSPDSVAEDATATTVTVTAELDGSALSTATEVTVTDAGTGTATSGTDYEAINSFTVTIDATQTSGTATFTLTPTNDSAAEPNETVVLSGAADGLESGTATLTITDDDTPTAIALSVNPDSVAEDATATTVTVTAELDGSALSTATTVTVTDAGTGTATSGTDYEAVTSFTVTIDATQTSGTATFTLTPANDSAAEPNETVVLSGAADGLESGTATLTITDDDTPTAIALSVSPDSVAEDATATMVTVTAELDGSALSTATTVTVTDAGTGTATSGTDYEAINSFTVTIDATQTSGTATFTLTAGERQRRRAERDGGAERERAGADRRHGDADHHRRRHADGDRAEREPGQRRRGRHRDDGDGDGGTGRLGAVDGDHRDGDRRRDRDGDVGHGLRGDQQLHGDDRRQPDQRHRHAQLHADERQRGGELRDGDPERERAGADRRHGDADHHRRRHADGDRAEREPGQRSRGRHRDDGDGDGGTGRLGAVDGDHRDGDRRRDRDGDVGHGLRGDQQLHGDDRRQPDQRHRHAQLHADERQRGGELRDGDPERERAGADRRHGDADHHRRRHADGDRAEREPGQRSRGRHRDDGDGDGGTGRRGAVDGDHRDGDRRRDRDGDVGHGLRGDQQLHGDDRRDPDQRHGDLHPYADRRQRGGGFRDGGAERRGRRPGVGHGDADHHRRRHPDGDRAEREPGQRRRGRHRDDGDGDGGTGRRGAVDGHRGDGDRRRDRDGDVGHGLRGDQQLHGDDRRDPDQRHGDLHPYADERQRRRAE